MNQHENQNTPNLISKEDFNLEKQINEMPVTVGQWVLTLLLVSIPVVNLIMLIYWAASNNVNKSKKNYALASLIWMVIVIVLWVIFGVFFASIFFANGHY